jgi:hypothetical protein
MAAGKGRFRNIEPGPQLRAIEFVTQRAYGPPPEVVEIQRSEDGGVIIKRVIGVIDRDV